jgi:hypothetical protein
MLLKKSEQLHHQTGIAIHIGIAQRDTIVPVYKDICEHGTVYLAAMGASELRGRLTIDAAGAPDCKAAAGALSSHRPW